MTPLAIVAAAVIIGVAIKSKSVEDFLLHVFCVVVLAMGLLALVIE